MATVKATLGDDTRKIVLDADEVGTSSVSRLQAKIRAAFGLDPADELLLKYVDGEGDTVTLTTAAEFSHLVAGATAQGPDRAPVVRLKVYSKQALRTGMSPLRPRVDKARAAANSDGVGAVASPLKASGDEVYTPTRIAEARGRFPEEFDEGTIYEMLRDISQYIVAREGMAPYIYAHVTRPRSLITQRTANPTAQPTEAAADQGILDVSNIGAWKSDDVGRWLEANELGEFGRLFAENDITGDLLLDIDHDTLRSMGIDSAGKRLKIIRAIGALHLFLRGAIADPASDAQQQQPSTSTAPAPRGDS